MNKFIYVHTGNSEQQDLIISKAGRHFEDEINFHIGRKVIRRYSDGVLISAISNPKAIDSLDYFYESDDKMLVFSGVPYFEDQDTAKPWNQAVAERCFQLKKAQIFNQLLGDYSLVQRSNSEVFATSGFSGFEPIYYYERDGMVGISNRQRLLQRMLHRDERLDFDPDAYAWLMAQGNVFGGNSPFRGVKLIASSRWIKIGKEGLITGGFERFYDQKNRETGASREIVSGAADALFKQAKALAKLPIPMVQIDLTGGKDSRAILAIAIETGLIDKVSQITSRGAPDHPDVQVATHLAEKLNLHQFRNVDTGITAFSYNNEGAWNMMRRSIFAYDGIVSPRLGAAMSPSAFVNLSGTGGELFGNIRTGPKEQLKTLEQAYEWVEKPQMMLDPLIVETDAQKEHQKKFLRSLLDHYLQFGVRFDDIQYLLWLEHRFPWWAGYALSSAFGRRTIFPFMNKEAAKLVYSLPPSHKSMQQLHFELMRKSSSVLIEVPFLSFPFDERLQAEYPNIKIETADFHTLTPESQPAAIPDHNRMFAQANWDIIFDIILSDSNSFMFDFVDRRKLENRQGQKEMMLDRMHSYDALISLLFMKMNEQDQLVRFKNGEPLPAGPVVDYRVIE